MKKSSEKRAWMMGVIFAAVAPFAFFSTSLEPWKAKSIAFMLAQELFYPFEFAARQLSQTTSSLWRHYIYLTDTEKENERLKKELAMLQTRVIDYEHQQNEVLRLRKLLGFTQEDDQKITVAEVISSAIGSPFQSIRISKGKSSALRIGMPVVAAKGVVGRILRTGSFFSDIQLISDSSFHLDILVERTRTRGVLQGIGHNRCHLQLHRRADIRIGDTLITSGIVGGFPKGLPVGRVSKISYESDDVSQVVTIQPWVDYRQLEEAVVIHHADEGLETIAEAAGDSWIKKPFDNQSSLQ